MSDHRVPMLGASLHRYRDPAQSSDPRVRELVGALATLEPAPAPRPEFRAELRAQLVAVAPRLIAEGPADNRDRRASLDTALGSRRESARSGGLLDGLRSIRLGKPLAAAACTLAVFAALLGGAVWLGRNSFGNNSLPGHRATGDAGRAMSSNDTIQARLDLQYAAQHYASVIRMIPASGRIAPSKAGTISNALSAADNDIRDASSRLGNQAVRNAVKEPLTLITAFAPGEIKRLDSLSTHVKPGPVRTHLNASSTLLRQAERRATVLMSQVNCTAITKSGTDDLGPLPVPTCSPSSGTSATHNVPPATGPSHTHPSAPNASIPSSLTGAPSPTGAAHSNGGAPAAQSSPASSPSSSTSSGGNGGLPLPPSGSPAGASGSAGSTCTPLISVGSISLDPCSLLSKLPH